MTTGTQPNISAYSNNVIIAVLTNMAANNDKVIPIVSFVIVLYLENFPRAFKRILSKKFTIIIIKAVAILMIVIETYYI